MEAAGSTNFRSTFSDNATGVIKAGSKCIRLGVEAGRTRKAHRTQQQLRPQMSITLTMAAVSFDKSDYLLRLLLTTSSG